MSREEYQRLLNTLQRRAGPSSVLMPVYVIFPRMFLRAFARSIERIHARLAAVNPPKTVVEEHRKLLDAFSETAKGIRRIAGDRKLGRMDLFEQMGGLPSLDAAIRAGDAMRQKGFEVPLNPAPPTQQTT